MNSNFVFLSFAITFQLVASLHAAHEKIATRNGGKYELRRQRISQPLKKMQAEAKRIDALLDRDDRDAQRCLDASGSTRRMRAPNDLASPVKTKVRAFYLFDEDIIRQHLAEAYQHLGTSDSEFADVIGTDLITEKYEPIYFAFNKLKAMGFQPLVTSVKTTLRDVKRLLALLNDASIDDEERLARKNDIKKIHDDLVRDNEIISQLIREHRIKFPKAADENNDTSTTTKRKRATENLSPRKKQRCETTSPDASIAR